MKSKIKLMLPLLLLLGGCTLMPHYFRPASPVPQQFPGAQTGGPTAKPTYDIGWQEFFKDPRLQQLITLALQNNRDYRIALLNVQQIHDQYRIVQYALLPSFGLSGAGVREREFVSKGKYSHFSEYSASVNISYEIDLFGQIRSLQKQAIEQYLASEEASRSTQITLVSEVAMQYLNERSIDEQLQLLENTLKSVEDYRDLIEKSYQAGNSSALDLAQAQAQVESSKVGIANYERQRAQIEDALMVLVGEDLPDGLPAPRPLESQDMMEDLSVGASSDLIERRPDILSAEHQLIASNANIGAVRAAFFPNVTLLGADGSASAPLTKLFRPGTQIWSFNPQINLPLFNQNTNVANLHAAQVAKKIQIAQYEKTIQTAFSEVSDAIAARDTYNQQFSAQKALVDAEQERYDLASQRYKSGIDSYLTVLLAQQDLYTAQQNLIQVSLDRLTNLISLYKALGGGWSQ